MDNFKILLLIDVWYVTLIASLVIKHLPIALLVTLIMVCMSSYKIVFVFKIVNLVPINNLIIIPVSFVMMDVLHVMGLLFKIVIFVEMMEPIPIIKIGIQELVL